MGGLNSLGGLNNVNVDFRPTVELAQAMTWTELGGLDWDGEVGQAVQAAIDAQLKLSEELGNFNNRLVQSDKVTDKLQDHFTELQFQCDRRATEINSVVTRMYDLAQKNVAEGKVADPKIQALLNAKFMELLPREAIMMHGTAEAFEAMNRTLDSKLRPLAEKLDAFKADGSKILTDDEIKSLQAAVTQMKYAVANVRNKGLEIMRGDVVVSCIEVDKAMGEDEKTKSNFVKKYFTNSCPSYYKRDYLDKMFK